MSKTHRSLLHSLAVALICTVFAALPVKAVKAEVTKLKVSIIPIIDVAPLFVAMKEGYFAEENLEIDTAPVAGGAAGIPALVAGAYDISFSNVVSALLARQQGIDVKIIAPGSATGAEPPDGAGLVVRKGEGLKTGKDLEGKSLAVNTRNNIIWLYAREWIAQTGGDPEKVNYREVPFPQMIDVLRGKQVDSAFMVQPLLLRAMGDPAFERIAWPYNDVQPSAEIAHYLATSEFIAKNPEVVERFVRALAKGAETYNATKDSEGVVNLVAGYTRIPAQVLANVAFSAAPDTIQEPSIGKTMGLMIKHGLLPGEIDLSGLLHTTAK